MKTLKLTPAQLAKRKRRKLRLLWQGQQLVELRLKYFRLVRVDTR